MNSKRDTPQGKAPGSALRSRTPTLLNSTSLSLRNSASRPARSASALNLTTQLPNIKASLAGTTPFFSYDIECDCAYSSYLQALLKNEITENISQQHEEDMNGQIIVQRENLSKGKVTLEKLKQEIVELEKLDKISELITVLDNNFTHFCALSDKFDLEDTLPRLLAVLNAFANRISVKNVKKFDKQEDFEKFNSVHKECVSACERIDWNDKNMKEVIQLAIIIEKYQENSGKVLEKLKFLSNAQKNEVYKLFKSVSDMYVEKEKY